MKVSTCSYRPILVPCGLENHDYQVDPYVGCEHCCYYCYVLNQAETDWTKEICISVKIPMGMFLCDDGLFYGVHTTNRRTVSIAATVNIPRADTLKPGDLFRFLLIPRPYQMSSGGARCAEYAFELKTREYVGIVFVMVKFF